MSKRRGYGTRASPSKSPKKKRRAARKKVIKIYDEKFAIGTCVTPNFSKAEAEKRFVLDDNDVATPFEEAIYAARMVSQKKWEYCVKWHGWPLVENEYEPEEHLAGPDCERLLASFWAMSVCDRPDMTSGPNYMMKPQKGVVIKADEEWYKQEIKYYEQVVKDSDDEPDTEVSSGEEEID